MGQGLFGFGAKLWRDLGLKLVPVLNLGVIDFPYVDYDKPTVKKRPSAKGVKGKATRPKGKAATNTVSTGDVAEFLEAKYHIMEHFFQENENKIRTSLFENMKDNFENQLRGAPDLSDVAFLAISSQIESDFKLWLSQADIEQLGYPGIPTKAALMGVNHRLKGGKGARRPSFIDTGQFQAAFKTWVEAR
jgi:hypothetical protein